MIDSHFHCWRRPDAKQAGILGAPYLQRDFPFSELASKAGPELEAAVEVQVNDFADGRIEAAYVEEVATTDPKLKAHIAWAQIEAEDAGAQLDSLRHFGMVRGVRRTCQFEEDPEFCARPEYVRGARLLGERGLICEICVRKEQIASVPRLAAEAPDTTIVLQHIGKPDLSRPPTHQWRQAIAELGGRSNVVCKLSVVVHSDRDPPYQAETQAPFLDHVVDCFGWDRVLYGSNWPVAEAVVGHRAWRQMLTHVLSAHGAGAAELAKVFSENARVLYRL